MIRPTEPPRGISPLVLAAALSLCAALLLPAVGGGAEPGAHPACPPDAAAPRR